MFRAARRVRPQQKFRLSGAACAMLRLRL